LHRGELQLLLLRAFLQRLGPEALSVGHRLVRYEQQQGGVAVDVETKDGERKRLSGSLLIGADGLHSAVRAQMYPSQPPVRWGGHIMWRGVTEAQPIRTGASFVGLGSYDHRLVFYPISQPDKAGGLATINWIAGIAVENPEAWGSGDWNKQVPVEAFIHHFSDWQFDWLDEPFRVYRRLQTLRGLEYEQTSQVFTRGPGTGRSDGARA
jgi:2-polyprenyl-6-methoxyphenol hydroxylase-like FAD-dependent oxidoreductase